MAVGALSLAIILVVTRFAPRIPGTIVALVAGTIAVWLFSLPVETVGSRFGGVPSGLPTMSFPAFSPSLILKLLSPAVTVAMLGAIESLMSAVVADRMSGDKHNPNVELIAQGVANIASPMFGGLPATGAIARTATNIRSGARTPVAGMVHSLTLLGVLLAGASLAGRIPMAVLAAILFVVAWRMGEWSEIPALLRQTKADIAVWLVTFALTVFADLTVAVEVGMVMAALLFIRRIAVTTTVSRITPEDLKEGRPHVLQGKPIPDYVAIYRIHGPFLFGATDKIHRVVDDLPKLPPIIIFRLRNMTALDATGLKALEDVAARVRASGRTAVFCGAREQPRAVMHQAQFIEHVGAKNLCPHVDSALARAADLHAGRASYSGGGSIVDCGVGPGIRTAAALEAADRADGHVVVAENLARQPHAGESAAFEGGDFGLRLPLRLAGDELDAAGRAARVAAARMELIDAGILFEGEHQSLVSGTSNSPTDSTIKFAACLTVSLSDRGNQVVPKRTGEIVPRREAPVAARGRVVDVLGPGVHDALTLLIDLVRDVRGRKRAQHFACALRRPSARRRRGCRRTA